MPQEHTLARTDKLTKLVAAYDQFHEAIALLDDPTASQSTRQRLKPPCIPSLLCIHELLAISAIALGALMSLNNVDFSGCCFFCASLWAEQLN